jgi:hypothetical protein
VSEPSLLSCSRPGRHRTFGAKCRVSGASDLTPRVSAMSAFSTCRRRRILERRPIPPRRAAVGAVLEAAGRGRCVACPVSSIQYRASVYPRPFASGNTAPAASAEVSGRCRSRTLSEPSENDGRYRAALGRQGHPVGTVPPGPAARLDVLSGGPRSGGRRARWVVAGAAARWAKVVGEGSRELALHSCAVVEDAGHGPAGLVGDGWPSARCSQVVSARTLMRGVRRRWGVMASSRSTVSQARRGRRAGRRLPGGGVRPRPRFASASARRSTRCESWTSAPRAGRRRPGRRPACRASARHRAATDRTGESPRGPARRCGG